MFLSRNVDKDHNEPKLALFALIIGIMYLATTGITVFGIVAAAFEREKLVQTFAWSTIAAALCVCGAGFLRVIVHFIHKNDLITECTNVVTGSDVTFQFGLWGPRVHDILNPSEAAAFCKDGWNHDSVSEIISLLVEILLAVFFVFVTFGYAQQVHQTKSDRKHAMASATDFEDSAVPGSSYPAYYNPPYLGYAPSYDSAAPKYDSAPKYDGVGSDGEQALYPPPPGPPPGFRDLVKKEDEDENDDPFADFESVKKRSRESLV
ncbi:hypothetical protein EUX98_g4382 [Antrodiella citrinella]|uniref:Uncharacterized protein n=1 Tax=Antrodiella citrinella TaxID=2447956 RepID=A0A4S4MWM8_9APHY|nr:hypothetical protein EUX98_g4382 [Antrodiella citrinella]